MKIYKQNHDEASQTVLDSDPVARLLFEFLEKETLWEGSATDLLDKLKEQDGYESVRYSKMCPKAPNCLSNILKRLSPALIDAGFSIENVTIKGKKVWRLAQPKTDTANGGVDGWG